MKFVDNKRQADALLHLNRSLNLRENFSLQALRACKQLFASLLFAGEIAERKRNFAGENFSFFRATQLGCRVERKWSEASHFLFHSLHSLLSRKLTVHHYQLLDCH